MAYCGYVDPFALCSLPMAPLSAPAKLSPFFFFFCNIVSLVQMATMNVGFFIQYPNNLPNEKNSSVKGKFR